MNELTMPLEEAMRTQRAVRRLKPDPVDDELVLRLIELATKAPSGSNQQNWEFVVVRDRYQDCHGLAVPRDDHGSFLALFQVGA